MHPVLPEVVVVLGRGAALLALADGAGVQARGAAVRLAAVARLRTLAGVVLSRIFFAIGAGRAALLLPLLGLGYEGILRVQNGGIAQLENL